MFSLLALAAFCAASYAAARSLSAEASAAYADAPVYSY